LRKSHLKFAPGWWGEAAKERAAFLGSPVPADDGVGHFVSGPANPPARRRRSQGLTEEFAYLVFQTRPGNVIRSNNYCVQPEFVQALCVSESPCETTASGHGKPSGLEVSLVCGRRLTGRQVSVWRALQRSNPELANPCFAPEFTQSVAAVRNDVEVAFLHEAGEVAAIFPFQRRVGSRAIPAGGIVSDYQGLICRPGFSCDPKELLKRCGLVAWDFDRLLASQSFFAPHHNFCEPSARIELSEGYEAYVAQRQASGTRQIKQCEYLMRRMEREVGPLRFVGHASDPQLLAQVLDWKSQQYRQSGWKDLFAAGWGRELVERIHGLQTPGLSGRLSLLYAGQRLVAGHMGMCSQTVWHYWFPAYDRRFAKYSPGILLLLKMAQAAETLGLRSIDLGTGMTLYKKRLMNASVSVAEGSVERPTGLGLVRLARRRLKSALKVVAGR
jgi:CelD/BcsL family acetyltransferase involved in cellulose biosynthesis